MLQGLYSIEQTDWIIPPPIEGGIIPKNAYGNMDVYVPSMVPRGAAHIPMRGTVRLCKKLGIDYAEAVTGFEFGARMAIPVISGVVIAEEHYENLMALWERDEAERVRKEDEKCTKAVLGLWRKMLMGLRVLKRMRDEYGHDGQGDDPLPNKSAKGDANHGRQSMEQGHVMQPSNEEMAGGFVPDGHDEEERDHHTSFFPVVRHDDDAGEDGGGFVVEDHHDLAQRSTEACEDPRAANDSSTRSPRTTRSISPTASASPLGPARAQRGQRGMDSRTQDFETPSRATLKSIRIVLPARRGTPATERSESKTLVANSVADVEEAGRPSRKRQKVKPAGSRRNARRKSTIGIKSKYFEHDEDEDVDDE